MRSSRERAREPAREPAALTVVVPTVGKWSRLRRTLRALLDQSVAADFGWEIVLVLDGVDVPDDLIPQPAGVKIVPLRRPKRGGRGAARNAGIQAASGALVVLLDDDILVGPGFIEAHHAAQVAGPCLCHGPLLELPPLVFIDDLDRQSVVPELRGASEPRIRRWARRVIAQLDEASTDWARFGRPSRMERDGVESLQNGRLETAWVAFAGANMSAPRQWFLERPFDERPGARWGLEDIAIALRLALDGKPLTLAKEARGLHLSHHRGDWKSDLRSSAICLDFLSATTVECVLRYLEGQSEIDEVGRALAGVFESARSASARTDAIDSEIENDRS